MLRPAEIELLDMASDAVLSVEDNGLIAFASPAALELLGWDGTLVGRPLTAIIPERLQAQHLAGFGRYTQTGVSRLQGHTVRVPARRRDGSEREMDLTIRVFERPDGSKLVSAALSVAPLGKAPQGLVVLETALVRRLYRLV
ncbi:MAG: hypothetical protein QOI63_1246 [Thermoplasmata archaeon]|jgi:PAS domain S-box-containing protein|nr:hypothetical protein [Thermoplasmata archaeon]